MIMPRRVRTVIAVTGAGGVRMGSHVSWCRAIAPRVSKASAGKEPFLRQQSPDPAAEGIGSKSDSARCHRTTSPFKASRSARPSRPARIELAFVPKRTRASASAASGGRVRRWSAADRLPQYGCMRVSGRVNVPDGGEAQTTGAIDAPGGRAGRDRLTIGKSSSDRAGAAVSAKGPQRRGMPTKPPARSKHDPMVPLEAGASSSRFWRKRTQRACGSSANRRSARNVVLQCWDVIVVQQLGGSRSVCRRMTSGCLMPPEFRSVVVSSGDENGGTVGCALAETRPRRAIKPRRRRVLRATRNGLQSPM